MCNPILFSSIMLLWHVVVLAADEGGSDKGWKREKGGSDEYANILAQAE